MSDARAFFDTNVFVYMRSQQHPHKNSTALRLLRDAEQSCQGVVSTQVVQEFFQVAFRLQVLSSWEESRETLWLLFGGFACIQSSTPLIESALQLRARYQLAWYDSLIVAAALEAKCSTLYSEDFQEGQVFEGSLTVVNPFTAHKN